MWKILSWIDRKVLSLEEPSLTRWLRRSGLQTGGWYDDDKVTWHAGKPHK